MVLEDGFCMVHSSTAKEVKEIKEKARKEKSEIAREFKLPSQKPIKQIRNFCTECCETWRDVQFCTSVDCKLWFLRFGMLPKAFVRKKGKQYARLFNKENFGCGRRYDSDDEIESMEL